MPAGDTPDIGTGGLAPSRLLAGCLVASLGLHAALFWLLPEWRREVVIEPVPVLDVVMVSRETEIDNAPPRALAPEVPRAAAPQPQPVARKPVPAIIDIPATLKEQRPLPAPADAVPVEPPRSPVASKGTPAPKTDSLTLPTFDAAYLRNPPPRYPPVARRNGDQGTVMLKVLVSPEGVPARVELDQSSGSSPLDGAALDAVKAWRFVPARRGAQNIEAWVRVPVVFRLES
jgi:protein TonB